ncbi:MAG: aldehyde ferredoxin oxidoreductase family protein [Pirellulaceae bacterium]
MSRHAFGSSNRSVVPGYHAQYLHVDLNRGTGSYMPLASDILRRFVGGSGLGTWLLLQHGRPTDDPLSPNAPLIFALSPLVGSPLTTSAKFAVVSKSPLTDRINDSLVSSGFAIAAKKCGCDALVLQGRAPEPSILVIDDGTVRLEPAGHLWGQTCGTTEQALLARFGQDFCAAVIGPAGERLVRFATVSHAGRHAGRGGSGAVLGSKNLKAILVRGTQRCTWAHPQQLVACARELSAKSLGSATAKYRELGTATNLLVFNRLHALPTRNFQQGSFPGVERLAPENLVETRHKTRASCVACTIGCEHIYGVKPDSQASGPQALGQRVRVEYENLFALGSLCGVSDPESVLTASKRCDELGLDTISAGGTIAFAMECVERGLLDAPWLTFGSGTALLHTLDLIAARKGLGEALSQGSRRLAATLGPEAMAFAPHVKGLEIPGYEPRAMQTLALGLAVSTRGADHNRSGAAEIDFSERADRHRLTTDAAVLAVESEDRSALLDSLILCRFLRNALDDFHAQAAEMLRFVTGWDVTAAELRQTARRIVTSKKLYNIRAGWTPAEDRLPDRFLQQALPDDPQAQLTHEQLHAAIGAYNRARGWTDEGLLSDQLLQRLDLGEFRLAESVQLPQDGRTAD